MRKVWILGFLTAAVLSAQPATVAAGHVRFGATLPATCKTTTGDVFFLTSGTTGVYSCTSTDTWTQPGSGGGGGAPTGAAGGELAGTYPNPLVAKFASDISALDFAACDGTTDDTTAFTTMSALAVNIHIPAGLTCVINAPTIVSHTHIIGGPNSRLLKLAGSTTTYLITTSSKTDVLFQNIILDGNSVVQTTANLYSVFISGGSDVTFDKVTFQNSGTPNSTMGGLDVFNASVVVRNSTFASTVQANQVTANINNNIANRVQILGNTLNGSQAKAIWVQNSGSEGICNAEVAGNYINNVTDSAGDAGQTGNAISIFQCDYANVHDNQIKTVRYTGVRVTGGSWNDVHDNTINGAQETAIYCSELGGGNNHCHHNTILNSASGINMTNVSSRSPDAPNVSDYNTCINVSYYCVYAEHDISTNNTADGVPFAFIAGHGATSHDNVMTGNTCTQSSASYYPVDVCASVDTGMTGTSSVYDTISNGSIAPTIATTAASNTPANLVITGITKAASAVVTTSSSLPASGSTVCFAQISGMVEINGLCGAVSSPSGSTFTVAINSTGFTTFAATPSGGTAPVGNALIVYSSGTTPANAFAANVTLIVPANVVSAVAPGAGIAHFAGSTQTATSSAIVNADITNATINLTTKVTGTLPLANGGTSGTDAANNGGVVWSNASGYKILAGTATANQPLVSGATATPAWLPYTVPATIAAHQTYVATGTTAVVAKTIPDCTDTGGNHINYTQSTDAFSCGATSNATVSAFTSTFVAGTGGTTAGLEVKMDTSNPSQVVTLLLNDTQAVGVALTSQSSGANVDVVFEGQTNCVADGTITAGHLLFPASATAGRFKDTGQTIDTAQTQNILLLARALASATVGQTFTCYVFTPHYAMNLGAATGILTPTNGGNGSNYAVSTAGLVTKINALTLAGYGVPAIVASGRQTAQSAADASVATFTPAADGSFEITSNVLVTTATTHSFTVTVAYTDEGNTARTATLNFQPVSGTITTTIANAGGAVPYMGVPLRIRAKAATAITVASTGTFTTVTYNIEAVIKETN